MKVKIFKTNIDFFSSLENEINLFLEFLEREKKVCVNTEIQTLGKYVLTFVFYEGE